MSIRTVDFETKEATETYVGCVLDEIEQNLHDDSYAYAMVWDDETKSVKSVATWSTAYYTNTSAKIDATPEIIERARVYAFQIIFEDKIKNHTVPAKGKIVKSLTTRGKAKGITGEILRFENSKFDSAWAARYNPTRVAVVKVTGPVNNPHYGRNVYVAPERLEVIEELTDAVRDQYRTEAWKEAHSANIRSLFDPRWGRIFRSPELYR